MCLSACLFLYELDSNKIQNPDVIASLDLHVGDSVASERSTRECAAKRVSNGKLVHTYYNFASIKAA